MYEFTIIIEETLRKEITVNADTECNAMLKVMNDYHEGTIVLDPDDFDGHTQFKWKKSIDE